MLLNDPTQDAKKKNKSPGQRGYEKMMHRLKDVGLHLKENSMRELMQIVEEAFKSSYEIRVENLVNKIKENMPNGIEREELPQIIARFVKASDAVEAKFENLSNSDAYKVFVKDIARGLMQDGWIKRKTAGKDKIRIRSLSGGSLYITKEEFAEFGMKLNVFAGNAFPDGDPFDDAEYYCQERGWDSQSIIDRAARVFLNAESYNDYLADMWNGYKEDQGDDRKLNLGDQNPWRSKNASRPRRRQFRPN